LNQSDITELRQTKFPSKGILQTMRVTCMLLEKRLDVKKIDWRTCQQMMQVGFFDKLKGFDKDDFVQNGNLQAAVEAFIVENPDFQPDIVRNASKACFSLCKWCFALTNYAKIAKLVLPKQKLVSIMEEELRKAK
jgi:dynein heavy chain, axonemal